MATGPLLVHPTSAYARTSATLPADAFPLGVASGDPLPDGIVLWTRLAPAASARPHGLRFAFASCQDYQAGLYHAYAHLAAEDLAFVAFLGDYIYEGPRNASAVRPHEGTDEPYSLEQYRARHATYKSDPNLRAAHAAFPWIVTFDDHEIDNNWADEIPQDPELQSPDAFRARRIAAFQAYYGAEITGTSITSGGNGNPASFHATYGPIMAESPHWRYIDNQRGYLVCDVTTARLEARLRLVDTVTAPTASVRTAATFTVESGRPGIADVTSA